MQKKIKPIVKVLATGILKLIFVPVLDVAEG
jgi:hypothetical protein